MTDITFPAALFVSLLSVLYEDSPAKKQVMSWAPASLQSLVLVLKIMHFCRLRCCPASSSQWHAMRIGSCL